VYFSLFFSIVGSTWCWHWKWSTCHMGSSSWRK